MPTLNLFLNGLASAVQPCNWELWPLSLRMFANLATRCGADVPPESTCFSARCCCTQEDGQASVAGRTWCRCSPWCVPVCGEGLDRGTPLPSYLYMLSLSLYICCRLICTWIKKKRQQKTIRAIFLAENKSFLWLCFLICCLIAKMQGFFQMWVCCPSVDHHEGLVPAHRRALSAES